MDNPNLKSPLQPDFIAAPPPCSDESAHVKQRIKAEAKELRKRQFEDNKNKQWKVVYPDSDDELKHRRLGKVVIYMLEHSPLWYHNFIWLGAENVPTTLHYLRQLAQLCNVSLKNGSSIKSFEEVREEVFKFVAPPKPGPFRSLVIFNNPKVYRNPKSLAEIQPFVPKRPETYAQLDFLVLTDESSVQKNQFDLPSSNNYKLEVRIPKSTREVRTPELTPMLARIAEIDPNGGRLLVRKIISLLYPDNMSISFIKAAVRSCYQDQDPMATTNVIEWIPKMISANLLLKVEGTDQRSEPTYCMDRSLSSHLRGLPEYSDLVEIGTKLRDFYKTIFDSIHGSETRNLFSPILGSDGSELECCVTEAAMHQAWLVSTEVGLFNRVQDEALDRIDPKGEFSSDFKNNAPLYDPQFAKNKKYQPGICTSLLDVVVEYVNTRVVGGTIEVLHREDPLGAGVFNGFIQARGCKMPVAIKCVPLIGNVKALDREAKVLTELNSPNIVQLFDYKEDPVRGVACIAMELCQQTLSQWVISQGHRDFEAGLNDLAMRFKLLQDANKGIAYLHRKGFHHRDIKPSNILLKTCDFITVAKISDFGLTKFTSNPAGTITTTSVGGTLAFMAPEALTGKSNFASDMYSFGKVCFFVLSCGQEPPGNFDSLDSSMFPWDFFGVEPVLKALVCDAASERISAEELLEQPMYWITGGGDQFVNFIVNLSMVLGKDDSAFHDDLRRKLPPLDWAGELRKAYPGSAVEEMINYHPRAKPGGSPANKPKEVAWYLRFCRNAIEHAVEHMRKAKLHFAIDQYADSEGPDLKPDRWKFFQTYFKPFPSLVYNVWKIAKCYMPKPDGKSEVKASGVTGEVLAEFEDLSIGE